MMSDGEGIQSVPHVSPFEGKGLAVVVDVGALRLPVRITRRSL
jgi:hypothetical protein